DWSSDVCASDLPRSVRHPGRDRVGRGAHPRPGARAGAGAGGDRAGDGGVLPRRAGRPVSVGPLMGGLFRVLRDRVRDARGSMTILTTGVLVVILMVLAVGTAITGVQLERNGLQYAADSAA